MLGTGCCLYCYLTSTTDSFSYKAQCSPNLNFIFLETYITFLLNAVTLGNSHWQCIENSSTHSSVSFQSRMKLISPCIILPPTQIINAVSDSNTIQTFANANSCPPWFVFSNNSAGKGRSPCECKENFGDVIICDEKLQKSYLLLNFCMTSNSSSSDKQESDTISFGACPYTYYNNRVHHRYIALPHNLSELNNIFCAPLNRHGLLCRQCIDGFGPSVISIGYACANCTENNYGWMLYILSEFVPATVFYFVVLTLRIRITSAPMNCFVMFSQLIVNVVTHNQEFYGTLMAELDVTSRVILKVILTGYGFWNLDYFRYLIPPFCVSQELKNIHVLALQYVSAFYPLLLIALTYACIELHAHNFRPIVWLWKPFHRCCVNFRRRWDTKASLIDVFATFLILSYSKLLFVSLYLLNKTVIYNADDEHVSATSNILLVDATVHYLSEEHLPFAITSILILFFLLLPPLLLIFYPCKVFNRCLNCCHMRRWHTLHTFVEVFQGCYKDGVTGGWDFRSISGVYLLFRFVLLMSIHMVHQIGWLLRALMFLSLSILILIVQPYKKSYMNVLDGLLLALLEFLTLLLVTFLFMPPSAGNETLPLLLVLSSGIPQLVLLFIVSYQQLKGKRRTQCIAGKVNTLLKKVCTQNQTDEEISVADSLPHRLISPNQYDRCESEQTHANTEIPTVRGQVSPVYTYGSIS